MSTTTIPTLHQRPGDRPSARPQTPHQQLDQNAPIAMQDELWKLMSGLEDVRTGPSGISLPDTKALHLEADKAKGPKSAFAPGAYATEFAHLHGPSDGSVHACLPEHVATEAIGKGWAEHHPIVKMGLHPPTLVMIYGPRDAEDLETIWQLVRVSYAFARGDLA